MAQDERNRDLNDGEREIDLIELLAYLVRHSRLLIFALIAGLVIVPIVSLLSKKPDKEDVDKIFSCYDKKNQVPVTQSLE